MNSNDKTMVTYQTPDAILNLPVEWDGQGGASIRFQSEPGLFQFSLFLEAARFDWDSLYQVLNIHQNVNERTGPWDFELATARPLVPSYWIELDGKKLGLWYVQRVSLEDVAHKRFRGRLAFDVRKGGAHELTFKAFKPMQVEWRSARLEPDPEDRFDWSVKAVKPVSALPLAAWSDPAFWQAQRAKLQTTHQAYEKALQAVFEWVRKGGVFNHEGLLCLVAAWRLDGQEAALGQALKIVDQTVALPAWGRPAEDVYGHNGDIGGASMLRAMAWAYHMLGDALGAERQARLLAKLTFQGEAFWEQLLLMRDYWGGSLLQDHGRKAVHDFGTATLCLWGLVPEADRWAAYIVPRIQRGLDAAPRDGVIPGSSYYSLAMYTDNLMFYREALLARTGIELIGEPSLAGVPAFAAAILDESGEAMLAAEADRVPLIGGQLFLETVAARKRDAAAAHLNRLMLRDPAAALNKNPIVAATGYVWGFLNHDPATHALALPARPKRELTSYDDSGFVHYRDSESGLAVSVKCAPWLGYHAVRHATGPCDLMEMLPGAGHFSLFLNGQPRLVSPDTGYRLHTWVRSVMLVDGKGQTGDVGYPMSIPSQPPRGERIESVRWDAAAGEGVVRLDLKPAYAAELGVAGYTREFRFSAKREMVCRDIVVLHEPRVLSWLFHFREDMGGRLEEGLEAVIGKEPGLRLQPRAGALPLTAAIQRTKVVYSYSSAFNRFQQVRYETAEKTGAASVDFVFRW